MSLAGQYNHIGTRQSDLLLLNRIPVTYSAGTLTTAATALLRVPSAAVFPAEQANTQSSSDYSTGLRIVTPWLAPANVRSLCFAMSHATSADALTATGAVFGIRRLRAVEAAKNPVLGVDTAAYFEEVHKLLFTFSLVGGANAIPATSKIIERPTGIGSINWCDTVTVGNDYTRTGVTQYHEASDHALVTDFDGEGFSRLAIEVLPGANGTGVFVFMNDL